LIQSFQNIKTCQKIQKLTGVGRWLNGFTGMEICRQLVKAEKMLVRSSSDYKNYTLKEMGVEIREGI
jgi:hypothetical protein